MAKETLTLKVAPEDEQRTIDSYQVFGWEVVTTQQIYSKDSHLEDKDDKIFSVTETTNFVRILLTRDKNMPNYNELSALQREYEGLHMPPAPNSRNGVKIFSLVLAACGLGVGLYALKQKLELYFIILGIILFAVGIVLFKIISSSTKKNKENYDAEAEKIISKQNEVVARARELY